MAIAGCLSCLWLLLWVVVLFNSVVFIKFFLKLNKIGGGWFGYFAVF